MALTQDRIGEIAMKTLQSKMEVDGIRLNPKEIKRDVLNESKKLGVPVAELAEFVKIMMKRAFDKTMAELDTIK